MRRLHPAMRAALGTRAAGDERFQAARQTFGTQAGDGMWGWMGHGRRDSERGQDSTTPDRRSAVQNQWFKARPMK